MHITCSEFNSVFLWQGKRSTTPTPLCLKGTIEKLPVQMHLQAWCEHLVSTKCKAVFQSVKYKMPEVSNFKFKKSSNLQRVSIVICSVFLLQEECFPAVTSISDIFTYGLCFKEINAKNYSLITAQKSYTILVALVSIKASLA